MAVDTYKIKCREHGGWVVFAQHRGRRRVSCTEDNQCDAVKIEIPRKVAVRPVSTPERVASEFKNRRVFDVATHARTVNKTARRTEQALEQHYAASDAHQTTKQPPQSKSEPRSQRSEGRVKAEAAKSLLEAQGWTVAGKAWRKDDHDYVTVVATRGEEMTSIMWVDGALTDQHYSLWNTELPSRNGKPQSKLSFNPDEIPDYELAAIIAGAKVTFYNRLAKAEESFTVSREKVTIEHMYNGKGDETPGERVVKFVDANGHGFRAFRLDQLLKVG